MEYTYRQTYNVEGPCLDVIGPRIRMEVQLLYKEMLVFKLPENCASCPVGFSSGHDCGRNVPFGTEDYIRRPSTCKLKSVDLDFSSLSATFESLSKLDQLRFDKRL